MEHIQTIRTPTSATHHLAATDGEYRVVHVAGAYRASHRRHNREAWQPCDTKRGRDAINTVITQHHHAVDTYFPDEYLIGGV